MGTLMAQVGEIKRVRRVTIVVRVERRFKGIYAEDLLLL
jgi:hypothetical protein